MPLPLRARCQKLDHALHQLVQIEGLGDKFGLAGLDLGEIEDLVDQREQRLARGLDGSYVRALLGLQPRVEQEARHAENPVQRRADSWLTVARKARLGLAGGFRTAALGDVAAHGIMLDQLAEPVA